jgi:flagellar basal body-associated protein FliL
MSPCTRALLGGLITLTILACAGCGRSLDAVSAQELLDRYEHENVRHDPRTFIEVDLGEYFVTYRQGADKPTFAVRFQMHGVIHENDESKFHQALAEHRDRMRDGVLSTVQRCDLDHLYEPTMAWLKAELVPEINRSLKTRALRDVVFNDFSFEQL